MNNTEFQLQGLSDPRLAVHATSPLPAWLWSTDGTRVLWANPVGAQLFGAANGVELAKKPFGPANLHRRQVVQLVGKLPPSGATRLQRLRGFGARPGLLVTCACMRIDFSDGSHGVLIAPVESQQRTMPLLDRLQRLIGGIDMPIAVFARDGMLVAASEAAHALSIFRNLAEAGLEQAGSAALATGRFETVTAIGHIVLQRVGFGTDAALVALMMPPRVAAPAEPSEPVEPPMQTPPYEQPALSGEAPAEFALIEAAAETQAAETAPAPKPATEPAGTDPEPSPYVAAVADEPANESDAPVPGQAAAAPNEPEAAAAWLDHPAPEPRAHPLRFVWQTDAAAHFTITSEEFLELAGAPTAAVLGQSWPEIARTLGLDPDDRVMAAFATRDTWSGITLSWPVEGGGSLPVELAGLATFNRNRDFAGFRGFGVCRDLDALARLAAFRRYEREHPAQTAKPLSADIVPTNSEHASAAVPPAESDVMSESSIESATAATDKTSPPTDLDEPVETPPNVVPFRPLGGEPKSPALSPVENSAFNELARQLSARLERDTAAEPEPHGGEITSSGVANVVAEAPEPVHELPAPPQAEWLSTPEPPAQGETGRDRTLLDLLPTGVLIYRLDRLLYANPAFLERMGYASLHELEQAGGLDALYVEPVVSAPSSTSQAGTPVTIAANQPTGEHTAATTARLFTISWDGESALALMFTPGPSMQPDTGPPAPPPAAANPPAEIGHASAEDLAAILDTTAEGILMFDAAGNIHACNRSAEALFGYDGDDLIKRNLADLFAPESQREVLDYLQSIADAGAAIVLDAGRDVLGRVSRGGIIPLSMTMGRTRPEGPNFFAVFRDQPHSKSDGELREARRMAERAASAKADMLARISHEVRTPLNAIIGFAEVMIGERFGPLGNERYLEYLKDIRASGERVIAIINDLTELSRIETGKLDLAFTSQNLNELVESCVSVMQPQANRERIIIRTSLAHLLPPVVADARSLKQITMNLIGNSMHLANPGGQVIVSTALSDYGEVVLRVRDTGNGLNDNEVAAALEPFRTPPPSDKASDTSPVSLSLTKALVEANRAQFHIKTGGRSGTLVEVVFARALARA
ncbi:PAS domain-containing protein [Bradyrhizobium sp. ARR65]|uniref:PAS domain-containing protein n=1 Tax=Bradyrhizobium sp. ARR65 TaxID=1040989 RepID=UPI000464B858|nr:PAS domain-containing protein [Bradyrhizobium sp. ARR65]